MMNRVWIAILALCLNTEASQASSQGKTDPHREQLSQLLLSSAWCSFSYNKVSGASHTARVQFSSNGTWSAGSRGETYSRGSGGTFSGQQDEGSRGRWKVQQGQLYMSNPPETPSLAPVNVTIAHNSHGHPIITADGTEYSQCQ